MNTSINKYFYEGFRTTDFSCEWLLYLGCPMIYDGGLCVNRTPEEFEHHCPYKYHLRLEV